MKNTVDKVRRAARKLFGANAKEAERYIMAPEDDTGRWAPGALAVIYLEPDFRFPEDTGVIPDRLNYWTAAGQENCIRLGDAVGDVFVEYVNAAVAAVYPA